MKIGDVAKQAGMTVEAVRFYEREGLLPRPPRTEAGYRVYADTDLRRLQFIRQAKRLGFSPGDRSHPPASRARPLPMPRGD